MMRPMPASMYPHAVTLLGHADRAGPGGGADPRYAGQAGESGAPVTIRADIQGPRRDLSVIAGQETAVDVWIVYTPENPDLTTPDPSEAPRKLVLRDGALSSEWPGIATVRGPRAGEGYDEMGVAVSGKFEVETVR